jgi:putative DNA primase/helicase
LSGSYFIPARQEVRKEMMLFENILEELKQLPQWVCRKEKIPFNPVTGTPAKAGQSATWAIFEDGVNALHGGGYDGIGFEFNNNGIIAIDLDHVISEKGTLTTEGPLQEVNCSKHFLKWM